VRLGESLMRVEVGASERGNRMNRATVIIVEENASLPPPVKARGYRSDAARPPGPVFDERARRRPKVFLRFLDGLAPECGYPFKVAGDERAGLSLTTGDALGTSASRSFEIVHRVKGRGHIVKTSMRSSTASRFSSLFVFVSMPDNAPKRADAQVLFLLFFGGPEILSNKIFCPRRSARKGPVSAKSHFAKW
jgi:hypothetical protein